MFSDGDGFQDGADAFATQREFKLPRQPTPHYAVLDLGEGEVVDMNDAGEVLIVNLIYEEEVLTDAEYRVWSGGNATALPAGNSTFARKWYRIDETGTAHGWDSIEELPIRAPAGDWANVTTLSGGCVTALLPFGVYIGSGSFPSPVYADRAGNDYFDLAYMVGEGPFSHQLFCWAANGTLSLVGDPVPLWGENEVERTFTLAQTGNHTLTLRQYDFHSEYDEFSVFVGNEYKLELRLNDLPVAGTQRTFNFDTDTTYMALYPYFYATEWRYAFDPAGLLAQWGGQTVVALPAAVRTDAGANPAAPNLAYQAAPGGAVKYMTLPADPKKKGVAAEIHGISATGLALTNIGLMTSEKEFGPDKFIATEFMEEMDEVRITLTRGSGQSAGDVIQAGVSKAAAMVNFHMSAFKPSSREQVERARALQANNNPQGLIPYLDDASKLIPSNLALIVNDDNSESGDIYGNLAGSDTAGKVPYPADFCNKTLAYTDPDVVCIKISQIKNILSGNATLTFSGNFSGNMENLTLATGDISSAITEQSPDIRLFKFQSLNDKSPLECITKPLSEWGPFDFASTNTSAHPLHGIKDNYLVFYLEGIKPNDHVVATLTLDTPQGTAKQEVHLQIVGTRKLALTFQYHQRLQSLYGDGAIKAKIKAWLQDANVIRTARYNASALGSGMPRDVAVPVVFRLNKLKAVDTDLTRGNDQWEHAPTSKMMYTVLDLSTLYDIGILPPYQDPDRSTQEAQENQGIDVYVVRSILKTTEIGEAWGIAASAHRCFALAMEAPSNRLLAHEWLHAFGLLGHTLLAKNIMSDPSYDYGNDVLESQRDKFLNSPIRPNLPP